MNISQSKQAINAYPKNRDGILIHDEAAFEGMRKAGQLAASVLDMITDHVQVGVTTEELDRLCHEYTLAHNAIPAPLGYGGGHGRMPFPKSICTSVNHVICHGIPGPKKLMNGDILNIDVTVILDGWHGDTSRMFCVGDKISIKAKRLIDITYEAMMRGIEQVKPGNTVGDIGYAIQEFAEGHRFGVVRDFCGHGLGQTFHMNPQIMHYGEPKTGAILEPGMFFTIEPMINTGTWEMKMLNDGWTAVTRDRGLSAQFEHSLAVTETGYEIFTLSPKGYTFPPYK
ncbi:MAG: type I methionyl aminopeptidase [Micavibrio sp.]|nr:type I methionyl aminopeptidase [Micavibrio sp.]|tara:strand:- start:838 stop:1689 length:852 start_codon:yes stop_codon:yes gene_type:complete